jgi:hypothetical protein
VVLKGKRKENFLLIVRSASHIQHYCTTKTSSSKGRAQNPQENTPLPVVTKIKNKAKKRGLYSYKPKPIDEPARGDKPTKSQCGYCINRSRLLPSRTIGINLSRWILKQ